MWQLILQISKLACLLLSAISKAVTLTTFFVTILILSIMAELCYADCRLCCVPNNTFIMSAFINVVHYFQPRLMFASKAQALPTDIDQNGSSRHTSLQYQGVDYYCKMIYSIGYWKRPNCRPNPLTLKKKYESAVSVHVFDDENCSSC